MPNSTKTCPKCGLELGTDALCARCLLHANFGSTPEARPTATGVSEEKQGAKPAIEPIGATIDRKYRIERTLGKGGMGTVFLATHLGTKRRVALKLISAEWTVKPEFHRRFQREAESLGRVRHPNVVNVTDFGIAYLGGRDMAYLVMEYLDGVTLAEHLSQSGPLSVRMVFDLIDQVASALDTAHAAGVVHRDLKPENIWVEPNRLGGFNVRVLDFGIAKLAQATPPPPPETVLNKEEAPTLDMEAASLDAAPEDAQTQRGRILGTPAYMSPEQCRGEALDGRSDVYSLGVIAYLLLAGELPYKGSSAELIRQHLHEPPPPLHKRRPGISRAISQTVAAALEKNPDDRPRTASAFAAMLRTNAECERGLLPRGRRLSSALPWVFFGLLLVNGALATLLFALLKTVCSILEGAWLDVAGGVGMIAILLVTSNCTKAGWAIALQEVLSRRSYDVPALTVLIAYVRKLPTLVLQQALSLLKIAPPFAKAIWPVVCIFEPRASSAERSIVLTGAIRHLAAALTVRWIAFAVLAVGYSLFVVPAIVMSHGGFVAEGWLFFGAALSWVIFIPPSMATLATFPFLYLHARGICGESAEPTIPATDTPEFPGNRIPALTRSTKLWIAVGILGIGVSVYARVSSTAPEERKTEASLKSAVELGKVRTVEKLVASGVDVNSRFLRPWTPLTRATLFGQEPVVDVLLKAGVNVNFHDPAVGTALYLAAVVRENGILKKLLDHGADPNATPEWGLTPLMAAAIHGNEPAVRLLLQHGADPKRRTPGDKTAEDIAREEGQTGVIALLTNGQ